MSGGRRKARCILSRLGSGENECETEALGLEEEPKTKDSRLESGRIRRSSRSRITDYFPPSSIPSDVIDDIIPDEEDLPSEGGSSSGKENDLDSHAESHGRTTSALMPVVATRSKAPLQKMPLTTFPDNVSPPPSPSKLGTSPSQTASSPPTPHKIKLMSKQQQQHPYNNNLTISLTPKKTLESSMPINHEETNNNNNNNNVVVTVGSRHHHSGLSKDFNVDPDDLNERQIITRKKQKKNKNTVVSTKKRTTTPSKKPNTAVKNPVKPQVNGGGSHKVTEYFPIRRSSRKSKKELDKQYTAELEDTLRNSSDDHLDLGIAYYSLKGRGIQAMRNFSKGEFVVEYAGDLVEIDIAKEREFQYSKDHSTGCYMYYFKHNEKQYCVDATKDTGRLGRLVNHSRVQPNLLTKVVVLENKPRLILVARQDIEKYSELLYDYGDRSKESLVAHPWLAL